MLNLGKRNKVDPSSAAATSTAQGQQQQQQTFDLSGSLTRQAEIEAPLTQPSGRSDATSSSASGTTSTSSSSSSSSANATAASHIQNIGKLIEDVESKIRSTLLDVYFGKTKDVWGMLRSQESLEVMRREERLRKELMGMWKR